MAEFSPEPSSVEVCEGHEKIGHGALLVAQQGGEVAGGFAGLDQIRVIHERQCLTRFSGLLERARIPAPASFRRKISNLA
jgi:hypothetical protein